MGKCIENKVNVYSFDSLDYCAHLFMKENSPIRVFWPSVRKCNVPQNTFGKLYKISKPVLGVFGTSSCQGKFTLQILLKELLEKSGYAVGHIGTDLCPVPLSLTGRYHTLPLYRNLTCKKTAVKNAFLYWKERLPLPQLLNLCRWRLLLISGCIFKRYWSWWCISMQKDFWLWICRRQSDQCQGKGRNSESKMETEASGAFFRIIE